MKVVLQRVLSAKVEVGGEVVGQIGQGLLVLWGIQETDTWKEADYLLRKTLNIKLWDESSANEMQGRETGKRVKNLTQGSSDAAPPKTWAQSVMDRDYEILIVSQFTLFGQVKKGNKPDFHNAMKSDKSKSFFEEIVQKMREMYKPEKVHTGSFGSFMQVSLVNDGPVTIVLDQGAADQ